MDITTDTSDARPVAVAFVKCFDATNLRPHGPPDPGRGSAPPQSPRGGHFRATIGVADAALVAAEREVPPVEPAPAAVMPVWALEAEEGNGDVLLTSANLWGTDVLVETLRVEDDDGPTPVASVRDRFWRWTDAAGKGTRLKTVRMLGQDGCYVLFAAAAPA
jgi:hypothetical protein